MNYLFLKRYNPAYDFCAISYLKEGGINMNEIPWERARFRLQLYDERKETLTPYQQFFRVYARAWVGFHYVRPAFYDVFWHIFGHLPDLAEVREQESKLPERGGRLLFSAEEIANDISRFYWEFIGKPLRKDILDGAGGDKISRYLTHHEWTAANKNGGTLDGIAHERQKAGKALLEWCERATPQRLFHDLEDILAEHFESPPHMKLDNFLFSHEGKKVDRCHHVTDYLKIDAARNSGEDNESVLLMPIRGEAQVRDGWLEVDFPWYHVLTES